MSWISTTVQNFVQIGLGVAVLRMRNFHCAVRKFGYLQGISLYNSVSYFIFDSKNFARTSRSCCQQSSWTVELADHTYDGRRVARRTQGISYMSVDRKVLTAFLPSRVGLLYTLFLQLYSSWQDFDWYSASCSLSAVEELLGYSWYRGNVQTPGPLVLWLSAKSIVPRHLSIAQVLSQQCLPGFKKNIFWENINGCRVILLLLILYNTLVSVTELLAKDRKYDDLLPHTWLAVERATGIIINCGKFEDLVLMIAKRRTYRHRDRDIIHACYSIVFWQRRC